MELQVDNIQPEKYPSKRLEFSVSSRAEPPEIAVDASKTDWVNYFLCGYKGIVEELKIQRPVHMRVMVDGTVPQGSGLSSSSALVCAAALATLQANGREMKKEELAVVTARFEKFVGIDSGGMDQAISFLAEQGKAKRIYFKPIRAESVVLPDGIAWFVQHTLVDSLKQRTGATNYNKRVVECRLASVLLAQTLKIAAEKALTLSALQHAANLSLDDLLTLVEKT